MAFSPHVNLLAGSVTVPPSPATSGTTLTLADASRFPDPATQGQYDCTVSPVGVDSTFANSEIIRVTGKASNMLTIARAQGGTTARAIIATDVVALTLTARVLTDIEAAVPGYTAVNKAGDSGVGALDLGSNTLTAGAAKLGTNPASAG